MVVMVGTGIEPGLLAKAPCQNRPGTAARKGTRRFRSLVCPPMPPSAHTPWTAPVAPWQALGESSARLANSSRKNAVPRHTENPLPAAILRLVIVGFFRWFYAIFPYTAYD